MADVGFIMNPEFLRDLDWVTSQMPRTARAIAALPDLSGVRLACSMHPEIKMAPAMLGLLQRGAELFLITCNPATVSDPFVEYCTAQGSPRFCRARNVKKADHDRSILAALDFAPTHLCEMGADLTAALIAGQHSTAFARDLKPQEAARRDLQRSKDRFPIRFSTGMICRSKKVCTTVTWSV